MKIIAAIGKLRSQRLRNLQKRRLQPSRKDALVLFIPGAKLMKTKEEKLLKSVALQPANAVLVALAAPSRN